MRQTPKYHGAYRKTKIHLKQVGLEQFLKCVHRGCCSDVYRQRVPTFSCYNLESFATSRSIR